MTTSDKTKSQLTIVHLGVIGVDTGRLIIGDPGYILPGSPFSQGLTQENLINNQSQLEFKPGIPGLAIVVKSGYGEGLYPVIAMVDQNGIIHEVRIQFTENELKKESGAPCVE